MELVRHRIEIRESGPFSSPLLKLLGLDRPRYYFVRKSLRQYERRYGSREGRAYDSDDEDEEGEEKGRNLMAQAGKTIVANNIQGSIVLRKKQLAKEADMRREIADLKQERENSVRDERAFTPLDQTQLQMFKDAFSQFIPPSWRTHPYGSSLPEHPSSYYNSSPFHSSNSKDSLEPSSSDATLPKGQLEKWYQGEKDKEDGEAADRALREKAKAFEEKFRDASKQLDRAERRVHDILDEKSSNWPAIAVAAVLCLTVIGMLVCGLSWSTNRGSSSGAAAAYAHHPQQYSHQRSHQDFAGTVPTYPGDFAKSWRGF